MLVWYFCVHQGVPQFQHVSTCFNPLCHSSHYACDRLWKTPRNWAPLECYWEGTTKTSGLRRAVVSPWLQALNPRHCRRSTRDKWYSLHGSRLGGPHLCKMWGEISSGILLSIEKNTRIHKRCSSATHLLTSFWFSRCRYLALKEGPS